jgi:hypothetical protein
MKFNGSINTLEGMAGWTLLSIAVGWAAHLTCGHPWGWIAFLAAVGLGLLLSAFTD